MLTRRSRKKDTSPNNVPPKTTNSPKATKSPTQKITKSPTSRRRTRSQSVKRKIWTRSKCDDKKLCLESKVILVRLKEKLKKETKSN